MSESPQPKSHLAVISSRRTSPSRPDPSRPYGYLIEDEANGAGGWDPTATVFLVNRQCPWRCVMCDLWQYTTIQRVDPGVIPLQIEQALAQLPTATTIKLYNAGSFFDVGAIPPSDYPAIARLLARFRRVIVECHPRLVDHRCLDFQNMIPGRLEIALGLETAHEQALVNLDKRFTLEDFSKAVAYLARHEIDSRVFLLVHPPYVPLVQAKEWLERSIDFALSHRVRAISLIPLRTTELKVQVKPPTLLELESGLEYGLARGRALVTVDPWDLERLTGCAACHCQRKQRLLAMNRFQTVLPEIVCRVCNRP